MMRNIDRDDSYDVAQDFADLERAAREQPAPEVPQPHRGRSPLTAVLLIGLFIVVCVAVWMFVSSRLTPELTVQDGEDTILNPLLEERGGDSAPTVPTEQPPQSGVSCPALPIPHYVLSHEGGNLRAGWLPGPSTDGIRRFHIAPITGEAKVYPARFDQNLQAMRGGQSYDPGLISMSNGEAYDSARHVFASWYYPLDTDPVMPESGSNLGYSIRYERLRADGTTEVIVLNDLKNTDRGPSGLAGTDLPHGIARITQAVAMRLEPEACVAGGGFNPACYDRVFTLAIIPNCQ